MVEGESSNARERRLKIQADLAAMTQRMEESDAEEYVYSEEESESERLREERRTKKRNDSISSESEQGEFEIGVNLVQEEGDGSPSEEGSDDSESEEEGEEVNQLVDESEQESNQDEPMEVEPQEKEEELPMYQEHYNALFSMDFVKTRYPHVDTMKALGIFEDVELVLKNMHLGKFFSHLTYKELTCEFLASMRLHLHTYACLAFEIGLLEHSGAYGHEEHGGTWRMEAAQLDTQRKKGEAILKTSSTTTRPTGRVPQLDRPSFNSIELRSQSQTRKMLLPP
ncbi:unnamed protein product [Microthlaspi erraticum]|uniref:Arabidopsis retrotransposon Orf1 C-terminal domain-containing protein n=1 Tax=Microthlaspi erraticum TaxID=1685480 RepID=A0A6D2HGX0_9BRAS|nr:unnamed protein product [Microthlaspi erraticum]